MNEAAVLIHGMWSTPDTLAPLADVFKSKGYDVHVVRLPGHLQKERMSDDAKDTLKKMSISDYVASVCLYIEEMRVQPIIIGHSMGALIAQIVATKVKCKALVTLSSAAPAGINGWSWSVIRTLGRNLFLFPLWRRLTSLSLESVRYGIANTQSAEVQASVYRNATYESGLATWQIGMWFLYRVPPSRVNYNAIRCPVLVLGGMADRVTPISIQRQIAKSLGSKATLIELPNVCHWTVADLHLPVVTSNILNWIKNHE